MAGGACVNIAHVALALRRIAQQRAKLFIPGRKFRRGHENLAVGIRQRQAGEAGEADTFHIGIHVGTDDRAGETGAVGSGDQQVAQIGALGRLVRHFVEITLGQSQLRHIELERGIVGQALKTRILRL